MMQEFLNQINETIKDRISEIHTAFPGRIETVNLEDGTANVFPILKMRINDDETMDYPVLNDVPIVFPQGNNQKCSIVFPVKTGDYCLVIVSEQSLDSWIQGAEMDTDLQFDLSDAICIPGLFQKAPSTLAEANRTNSIVISGNVKVYGSMQIEGTVTAENLPE